MREECIQKKFEKISLIGPNLSHCNRLQYYSGIHTCHTRCSTAVDSECMAILWPDGLRNSIAYLAHCDWRISLSECNGLTLLVCYSIHIDFD